MSLSIAVDDFDPLIGYSNYNDWTTPNPQDNPTWWNETSEVTGVPWYEATYHKTTVDGATAYFNFTGSSFEVYGADASNFTIIIDPSSSQPFSQTLSVNNASDNGRTLLYSTDQLSYSPHQVQIVNHGPGFLLDMISTSPQLMADGSSLTNTTVQDDNPDIKYNGDWTQQSGPNFSGGTSHYTEGPGNSWEYSFEGSAIWIFGDQVNDHGVYSIYLNDSQDPFGTYNGRSGCGSGDYAKYCEKLHGLIGFIGSLPEGTHKVKLENQGPSDTNKTFVDFDYLVIAKPDQYSSQAVEQPSQCPFTKCDGNASGTSGSPSSQPSGSTSASGSAASTSGAADPTLGLSSPGTWLGLIAMLFSGVLL